jgi:hypothetical protein
MFGNIIVAIWHEYHGLARLCNLFPQHNGCLHLRIDEFYIVK